MYQERRNNRDEKFSHWSLVPPSFFFIHFLVNLKTKKFQRFPPSKMTMIPISISTNALIILTKQTEQKSRSFDLHS